MLIHTLREKCPNMELFYGPEITPYFDTFHTVTEKESLTTWFGTLQW